MTTTCVAASNSTIVRFNAVLIAILLTVGCAAVTPLDSRLGACPAPGPKLCERYGPELRCACAGTSALHRELARFDRARRLGAIGY